MPKLEKIKKLFNDHNLLLLGVSLVFIFIYSLLNVYTAEIFKTLIDISLNGNITILFKIIIFSVIYFMLLGILLFVKSIIVAKFVRNKVIKLKKDLYESILNMKFRDFNKKDTGEYLSMFLKDIDIIEREYYLNILGIAEEIMLLAISIYLILNLNLKMAVLIIILSGIQFVIPRIFQSKITTLKLGVSKYNEIFTKHIREMFSGIEIMHVYNSQKLFVRNFEKVNNEIENAKYQYRAKTSQASGFMSFTGVIIFFSIFVFGIILKIHGEISIGIMIATLQLQNNISGPIFGITQKLVGVISTKPILKRVVDFQKTKEQYGENFLCDKTKSEILFELENISYENNNKKILDDISFSIKKGEKIALLGMSGTGKSTIIKILLDLIENYSGNVKYKGNICQIEFLRIYDNISYVSQKTFIFSGTIYENVTLFDKSISTELVENALILSGFDFSDSRFRDGIYTTVNEDGKNLSGGEKQKIEIARALLKKSEIIIMDEATSAIDMETTKEIEKYLVREKRSVLYVTHRENSFFVTGCDKKIMIANGKLFEKSLSMYNSEHMELN